MQVFIIVFSNKIFYFFKALERCVSKFKEFNKFLYNLLENNISEKVNPIEIENITKFLDFTTIAIENVNNFDNGKLTFIQLKKYYFSEIETENQEIDFQEKILTNEMNYKKFSKDFIQEVDKSNKYF